MADVPNPGSDEALALGCTCPVLDNAHGRGAQGTFDKPDDEKVFWMNAECSLHGHHGDHEGDKLVVGA